MSATVVNDKLVSWASGEHELTLRELKMNSQGIFISEPLHEFQGVLTGVPTYHGPWDSGKKP